MMEESKLTKGYYETTEEEENSPQTSNKIVDLTGVPYFHTLRMKGVLQVQRIIVLIDEGATHKFIYASLVKKIIIPTESFEGSIAFIPIKNTME